MEKVSIIIPCYNAARHLEQCLLFALMQSYLEKEIILVDDGSTDNSLEIAHQYSDRIIIIESDRNYGQSYARNTGFEYSGGDWIQYLDADDCLFFKKIENQLNRNCADIYIDSFRILSGNNELFDCTWDTKITNNSNDFILFILCNGGGFQPNTALFKREILQKVKNRNGHIWRTGEENKYGSEDTALVFDCLKENATFYVSTEISSQYRIKWSDEQITVKKKTERAHGIKALQQEVREWSEQTGRIHDIPKVQKRHIDFYSQSLVSEKKQP
jgi:glycosyltransferase involved in cell wall biosynthesis